MEITTQHTLGAIVKEFHAAASVFEKYHLDFCCQGKRTLEVACEESGLVPEEIAVEINRAINSNKSGDHDFNSFDPEQLISYIILKHHSYVKQSSHVIKQHLLRVATKHGERFPEMKKVLALFLEVEEELQMHLQKEEVILFPRIREVYHASVNSGSTSFPPTYLNGPIQVMEAEHSHAGNALYEIRQLTNNYTVPEGACTTFNLVINELKAFEEDLHQHVHLENNILFPKGEEILLSLN
jgi:regulator of cell morphogenesis and NO signaling